ncbi:NAD(P)H-dependent oxidoreductase [Candidatus Uhrbacteria bacterium]|nr:NAD(P)H-dependent oxidoreductase [Candidatus Uhrbacteria bacterium]
MWWKKQKIILPSIVLIQGSLQPDGLTDILLAEAVRFLGDYPITAEIVDVRNRDIDFYDTRKSDEYAPSTTNMIAALDRAAGYVIAMPVYSTTVSGAVKDLITFASLSMNGKRACLICVGKGDATYTASVNLVRLLASHGVAVVKPVLRVHPESFRNNTLFDEQVHAVLKEMLSSLMKQNNITLRAPG